MTTETKPQTKTPPAQVVGSLVDVMKRVKCTDGRNLFCFGCAAAENETYILAASELQAWKAMHSHLGTMQKMNQGKMSDRYRQDNLRLREEQSNGETKSEKAGE